MGREVDRLWPPRSAAQEGDPSVSALHVVGERAAEVADAGARARDAQGEGKRARGLGGESEGEGEGEGEGGDAGGGRVASCAELLGGGKMLKAMLMAATSAPPAVAPKQNGYPAWAPDGISGRIGGRFA